MMAVHNQNLSVSTQYGLYENNFEKLHKIDTDINYNACNAMNVNVFLAGRPHGGCAILWKNL